MSILYTNNIKELKNFTEKKNQLTILNRKAPSNAIYFFEISTGPRYGSHMRVRFEARHPSSVF